MSSVALEGLNKVGENNHADVVRIMMISHFGNLSYTLDLKSGYLSVCCFNFGPFVFESVSCKSPDFMGVQY